MCITRKRTCTWWDIQLDNQLDICVKHADRYKKIQSETARMLSLVFVNTAYLRNVHHRPFLCNMMNPLHVHNVGTNKAAWQTTVDSSRPFQEREDKL